LTLKKEFGMSEGEKLKRRWAEEDDAQIDAAITALLDHRHGRRLLWWMLEIGGVGRQPFSSNALHTAFNCGELNVGQRLLERIIFVSPQGYVNMMKENADERSSRSERLERANAAGGGAVTDSGAAEGTDAE
jgi:hypothetical protein